MKLWLGGSDLEAAQSQTIEAYPGVTYTRTVVRIGDYFVLCDRVQSEREHVYDSYLHGEGELSLDAPHSEVTPIEPPFRWVTDLSAQPAAPSIAGHWAQGRMRVAFWVMSSSPGGQPCLQALQGKCPAESGSRTIPLLIARQRGKRAEIITVLFPCQERLECSAECKDGQVHINHGKARDILILPPFGTRPTVLRE